MLETIIGLVVLVAWIIALVDIIKSGMDSTKKIIWALVVIILPLIGTILWFIIGKK
ncbi:PLD nuclease N-terminal domain-containing protein [Mucisphaera sp.]|uniref:PLD nuclease N-terminal domain-containing protein n=1 Tax=Mucisphaera sp. TaxID=2913024 RepID=UPI003D1178FC